MSKHKARLSAFAFALVLLGPAIVVGQDKSPARPAMESSPDVKRPANAALTAANGSSAAVTYDYMSSLERELLDELNLARTQPQKYAEFVAEWKQYYTGKTLTRPGRKPTNTFDGGAALDEAVAFLRAATP